MFWQETSSTDEEVEEEEGVGEETGSAEEIEEELCVAQDSLEGAKCRNTCKGSDGNLRTDDVIVLEFGRPQRKGRLMKMCDGRGGISMGVLSISLLICLFKHCKLGVFGQRHISNKSSNHTNKPNNWIPPLFASL